MHYIQKYSYLLLILIAGGCINYTNAFRMWRRHIITFVETTAGDLCSTGSTTKLQSSMSPSSFNSVELKKTAIKAKKLYSFQEARRLARGHGFSTKEEFLQYDCPGAYQLPKNPDEIYKEEGWIDWEDFLGIPYPTYEEAKRVVQKDILPQKRLCTEEDYLTFIQDRSCRRKTGEIGNEELDARIGRLPYRPNIYYQTSWLGWEDYLNVTK